ncbi:tyrosine-type recombinase/integrase [Chloroflexota bacterium]
MGILYKKQKDVRPVRREGASELLNLIQGYRICAKSEGKSPHTVTIYTSGLNLLLDYLEIMGLPTDVRDIGVTELRGYILYLQQRRAWSKHPSIRPRERGLASTTIHDYMRAIRTFWNWLVTEEIIPETPFTRIKIPRGDTKVVPTFTQDQIQALINSIGKSKPCSARDHTMTLFLLDTGVRVSELIGIDMDDVKMEQGIVKVFGKGSKERFVPIGAKVQRVLWKYINQHRPDPLFPLVNRLFLARDGRPLNKRAMDNIFKRHGVNAGITGVRCSPHSFRHTFAVNYIRNGGDTFSLQNILGHSSLDPVRIYVNLCHSDVKAAHRRFSPADNMDLKAGRL